MTRKDFTRPEVAGSDPELTSFPWKSLELDVEGQTRVSGAFELLQGCNSQEMAVTDRK